jgi:hypothetical protein
MAQVSEHLPSMCKSLSSTPITTHTHTHTHMHTQSLTPSAMGPVLPHDSFLTSWHLLYALSFFH